jgi:hypothetical protein
MEVKSKYAHSRNMFIRRIDRNTPPVVTYNVPRGSKHKHNPYRFYEPAYS